MLPQNELSDATTRKMVVANCCICCTVGSRNHISKSSRSGRWFTIPSVTEGRSDRGNAVTILSILPVLLLLTCYSQWKSRMSLNWPILSVACSPRFWSDYFWETHASHTSDGYTQLVNYIEPLSEADLKECAFHHIAPPKNHPY